MDIEGQSVRLRGSRETWAAVRNDFIVPCTCLCCETLIFCIANAEYIICPNCRVISRVHSEEEEATTNDATNNDGVGLGFTMEDLGRWQQEILLQQQRQEQQAEGHRRHRYSQY
jgi:hypothetical protein